ncbi:Cytochrome protein, partial [Fragariocoptes setiger]
QNNCDKNQLQTMANATIWSTLVVGLGTYLTLRAIMFIIERRRLHQRLAKHNINGPPVPSLVFGHMNEFADNKIVRKWHTLYGKVVGFYYMHMAQVRTNDVELANEIFLKQSHVFNARSRPDARLTAVLKSILFNSGDRWRNIRKLLSPALGQYRIKSKDDRCDDIQSGLTRLIEHYRAQLREPGVDKLQINVYDTMQALTLDVIFRIAFNRDTIDVTKGAQDPTLQQVRSIMLLTEHWAVKLLATVPFLAPLIGPFMMLFSTQIKQLKNLQATIRNNKDFTAPPANTANNTTTTTTSTSTTSVTTIATRQQPMDRNDNKSEQQRLARRRADVISSESNNITTTATTTTEVTAAVAGTSAVLAETVPMGTDDRRRLDRSPDSAYDSQDERANDSNNNTFDMDNDTDIKKSATATASATVTETTNEQTQQSKHKRIYHILVQHFKRGNITFKELNANIIAVLVAGFETTAATSTYITWLLARHDDVQRRLRDDIRRHGVHSQYLDQVIKETMRLYPALPNFVVRTPDRDVNINGVELERGCSVYLSLASLHYDEHHWPEPYKFDPERFAPGKTHHPCAYAPFGLGHRMCAGYQLAMREMKTITCELLSNFHLELVAPQQMECQTQSVFLTRPNGDVLINLVPLTTTNDVDNVSNYINKNNNNDIDMCA